MFKEAKAVWIENKAFDMNVQVGFRAVVPWKTEQKVLLRLTGSTLYRIYINGRFIHYGPARAAHGYARVDELDLTKFLHIGTNQLAIEVAGYNCNSYYTINQVSFLQAEVLIDGDVIIATGRNIQAQELKHRLQKVMRYSFQRTFSEVYDYRELNEAFYHWTIEPIVPEELEVVQHNFHFLPRELPIPVFGVISQAYMAEGGYVQEKQMDDTLPFLLDRFIHIQENSLVSGFTIDQIDEQPFYHARCLDFIDNSHFEYKEFDGNSNASALESGQYLLLDMKKIYNGFIQIEIEALEASDLYVLYDEKLIDGKLNMLSWENINIIEIKMDRMKESILFESFESYSLRYAVIYVRSGHIQVNKFGIREYIYPHGDQVQFKTEDEDLNVIFEAARQSYLQNTVDVFMDCPSRERAGWLCDSYFTAQASMLFSGEALAEKVFLENFKMVDRFEGIPQGMLPMCYPADHLDGNFIPQWAMWYIIELEGYLERDSDANIQDFKKVCYSLIQYFEPYINEHGLLEKLDAWNFVEWSKANDWVQDVNFPTNMLYAKAIELVGQWFADEHLLQQSLEIKEKIVELSFDGVFFRDHAIRNEQGELIVQSNRSEVCQYYAFFFNVASLADARFESLYQIVIHDFGPHRKQTGGLPEIAYANAFIGNYLRMELLTRWGFYQQVLQEAKGYFLHMARMTGTLWEHDSIQGSLNHGFASYAAVILIKSLFGIQEINERNGMITWNPNQAVEVGAAELTLNTKHGIIRIIRHNRAELEIKSIPDFYKLKQIS